MATPQYTSTTSAFVARLHLRINFMARILRLSLSSPNLHNSFSLVNIARSSLDVSTNALGPNARFLAVSYFNVATWMVSLRSYDERRSA